MSEEPKQQAPRDFQPIEERDEQLKLLRESAKTLASATVWTKDQRHVIQTHICRVSEEDKTLHAMTPKDFDAGKMGDELARLGSKEAYFSVSLSRANIFFRTDYQGDDSTGLRFKIPERIFKVQRRKDMRLPIPEGYVVKVEFEDPLFPEQRLSKKVLDISAGGLAILVSELDAPMFHAGLELKKLTLNIRGRKIVCSGEVRHTRPMPSDSRMPGVKVGVIFSNLRPPDAQAIASYVFEESRKYFSKFI